MDAQEETTVVLDDDDAIDLLDADEGTAAGGGAIVVPPPAARAVPSNNGDDAVARHPRSGDPRGKPLAYEIRHRIIRLLDRRDDAGKPIMLKKEIANLMNVHPRTVTKLERDRDAQGLARVHHPQLGEITHGVPVPRKQGGFRWCRLTDEQKATCTRIAMENPRMTIPLIRDRLMAIYGGIQVSESTVWRTLRGAGELQYMRAKLRDPRSEGDVAQRATNAELVDFFEEQDRAPGDGSVLDPYHLFFMDETTVYLNETSSRAWGRAHHPAVLDKAKGKTATIQVFAGLGLIAPDDRDASAPYQPASSTPRDVAHTWPRTNAMRRIPGTRRWMGQEERPRFALVWWFRPPRNERATLSRFLSASDMHDDNFYLFSPTNMRRQARVGDRLAIRYENETAQGLRARYYNGTVMRDMGDGRVEVRYDHGRLVWMASTTRPADRNERALTARVRALVRHLDNRVARSRRRGQTSFRVGLQDTEADLGALLDMAEEVGFADTDCVRSPSNALYYYNDITASDTSVMALHDEAGQVPRHFYYLADARPSSSPCDLSNVDWTRGCWRDTDRALNTIVDQGLHRRVVDFFSPSLARRRTLLHCASSARCEHAPTVHRGYFIDASVVLLEWSATETWMVDVRALGLLCASDDGVPDYTELTPESDPLAIHQYRVDAQTAVVFANTCFDHVLYRQFIEAAPTSTRADRGAQPSPISSLDNFGYYQLVRLLYLNSVEPREVSEDGELVYEARDGADGADAATSTRMATEEVLLAHFAALQRLARAAVEEGDVDTSDSRVPRDFATRTGRNERGGTYATERGDRFLFLKYLTHVTDFYDAHFAAARPNLTIAMDSAPTHFKVDVNAQRKSIVHSFAETKLRIRGMAFLPIRAPEYNPVEMLFAFIKSVIRRNVHSFTGQVSVVTMIDALDSAFSEVTEEMLRGWIRFGCYNLDDGVPRRAACLSLRDEHGVAADTFDVRRMALEAFIASHAGSLTEGERRTAQDLATGVAGAARETAVARLRRFATTRDVWASRPEGDIVEVEVLEGDRRVLLDAPHAEGDTPVDLTTSTQLSIRRRVFDRSTDAATARYQPERRVVDIVDPASGKRTRLHNVSPAPVGTPTVDGDARPRRSDAVRLGDGSTILNEGEERISNVTPRGRLLLLLAERCADLNPMCASLFLVDASTTALSRAEARGVDAEERSVLRAHVDVAHRFRRLAERLRGQGSVVGLRVERAQTLALSWAARLPIDDENGALWTIVDIEDDATGVKRAIVRCLESYRFAVRRGDKVRILASTSGGEDDATDSYAQIRFHVERRYGPGVEFRTTSRERRPPMAPRTEEEARAPLRCVHADETAFELADGSAWLNVRRYTALSRADATHIADEIARYTEHFGYASRALLHKDASPQRRAVDECVIALKSAQMDAARRDKLGAALSRRLLAVFRSEVPAWKRSGLAATQRDAANETFDSAPDAPRHPLEGVVYRFHVSASQSTSVRVGDYTYERVQHPIDYDEIRRLVDKFEPRLDGTCQPHTSGVTAAGQIRPCQPGDRDATAETLPLIDVRQSRADEAVETVKQKEEVHDITGAHSTAPIERVVVREVANDRDTVKVIVYQEGASRQPQGQAQAPERRRAFFYSLRTNTFTRDSAEEAKALFNLFAEENTEKLQHAIQRFRQAREVRPIDDAHHVTMPVRLVARARDDVRR